MNGLPTLLAAGRYGRWSAYMCLALLLYMTSYFAGVSSRFSNNLFYLLAGVPTLAFAVMHPAAAKHALHRYWPVLAMFALAVLSEVFAPEGDPVGIARAAGYLVVLGLALHVASANRRLITATFALFGGAAVVFGAAGLLVWGLEFLATDSFVRVKLNELNVTRASLLVLFGVLALWLFALEPILASRRAAWLKAAAFSAITIFCVAVALVFQSRSSIVALILFLFAYGLFEGRLRLVVGVIVAIAGVLLVSGMYEILLQRGGSYRGEIWTDAFRRLLADCSIFTGCGSGGEYRFYGQFLNPHSGYLGTLYYHGVATLAAFALLVSVAARRAWSTNNRFVLLSLVGLGGAIASSPGFIDAPEPQWVYFWMPLMLALNGAGGGMNTDSGSSRSEQDAQ